MDATAIQGLHSTLSGTGVIILDEAIVVTLGLHIKISNNADTTMELVMLGGQPTFLSGIILTFWTCPVVSKI